MQSIMNHFSLSPQCREVHSHLRSYRDKGLTCTEALTILKVPALPRRIKDLKEKGIIIRTERKVDRDGRRYVRYFLGA